MTDENSVVPMRSGLADPVRFRDLLPALPDRLILVLRQGTLVCQPRVLPPPLGIGRSHDRRMDPGSAEGKAQGDRDTGFEIALQEVVGKFLKAVPVGMHVAVGRLASRLP